VNKDKDDIIDKFKDIDNSKEIESLKNDIVKKTYREKKAEEYEKSKQPRDLIQLGYAVLIFFVVMGFASIIFGSLGLGLVLLLICFSPIIFKIIKGMMKS
jgi:hypothetical protein